MGTTTTTTTDDSAFCPGDTVCYGEDHYEWLVLAARWPSRMMPRRALDGEVISTAGNTVTVKWRHDADPHTHFASNLELMVSSAGDRG